jgi:hypothetical protein
MLDVAGCVFSDLLSLGSMLSFPTIDFMNQ